MYLTLANDLTYNSRKATLKCIFGDKINTSVNKEYNGNSIIKQEESAMVFEQSKNPKKKLNPMNKEKLLDVLFVIQRCIGQKIAHIKQI